MKTRGRNSPHAHDNIWSPAADEGQNDEDGHSECSGSGPAEVGRSGAEASGFGSEESALRLNHLDAFV